MAEPASRASDSQNAREVAPRWPTGRFAHPFDGWYVDQRGQISRPKLLATVCVSDGILVIGSALATFACAGPHDPLAWSWAVATALFLSVSVAVVLQMRWGYSVRSLRGSADQIPRIALALAIGCGMVLSAAYLLALDGTVRRWMLLWVPVCGALLCLSRIAIARIVARATDAGRLVRRTVIVGGGPEANAVIEKLEATDGKSVRILGVFDDRADSRSPAHPARYRKLGTFADLSAFCREEGVDLLIVTVPMAAETRLLEIIQRLWPLPVDVRISALTSKLRLDPRAYLHIGGVPLLAVFNKPLSDWDRVVKNVWDRVIAAVLCVALLPVMALVAIAVRLDSAGPVLFRQRRYGFNNELIEIYKFRSMRLDTADATAAKLVTRDDPRVTRVGRVIRRTSIDELPQLFNVLKGELSLVGPRPHATQAKADAELYENVAAGYFARHRVKPGVTGWAQINGWRGETDTREKIVRRVEHDLAYIDNWSVMFDLYILARTPFALLSGKNAY